MRYFVTGASGWIGSAVITELVQAGHQVVGLARSDDAAARVAALGAEVRRGDLSGTDTLAEEAAASDGVVHLGYSHDFSQMVEAAALDRAAIEAIGTALEGSNKPFVVASGVLGLAPGGVATELDLPDPAMHPRVANAQAALAFVDRGVRTVMARFAPTVHGAGDHGFVAHLVQVAREQGSAGYVDDGASRWPAVHQLDAGRLVSLALADPAAGTVVHAVGEDGVRTRDIAEAIGRGLGVPVVSVPREQAAEHFGWIGAFFGADCAASSELTRKALGWTPTGPTLLEDLATESYFTS